jgi:hypothetical protein
VDRELKEGARYYLSEQSRKRSVFRGARRIIPVTTRFQTGWGGDRSYPTRSAKHAALAALFA